MPRSVHRAGDIVATVVLHRTRSGGHPSELGAPIERQRRPFVNLVCRASGVDPTWTVLARTQHIHVRGRGNTLVGGASWAGSGTGASEACSSSLRPSVSA